MNTRYPLSAYEEPLQPGDYLLISISIADVEAFYSLPAKANCLECKLPALSNTGASVVLYRASDEEFIDEDINTLKQEIDKYKLHSYITLDDGEYMICGYGGLQCCFNDDRVKEHDELER